MREGEKGRAEDGRSAVQGQLLKGVIKRSEYRAKQRNDEIVSNDRIANRESNLSNSDLVANGKGVHFRLNLGCDVDSDDGNRRFVT